MEYNVSAYVEAIGTAVPPHDVHPAFLDWARESLSTTDAVKLFDRVAARSGIHHRWSVLPTDRTPTAPGGLYDPASWPGTGTRMHIYADAAPTLALSAIEKLADRADLRGVTHLVVASCTGFVAPGVDQIVARRLGLASDVERLLIGFMGCYAAVAALRSARHIVRSDPQARVLVVTVELSTLHLRRTDDLEAILAMLQFGDGAAAALVSVRPCGFEIRQPFAATLADSDDLIRWAITDEGFAMHLSGQVPGRIATALADRGFAGAALGGRCPREVDAWAVHAGGRSILDAVERALELHPDALAASRGVLADHGNMSSSTLMFVLARLLDAAAVDHGVALAFGPGLAAEGFAFGSAS